MTAKKKRPAKRAVKKPACRITTKKVPLFSGRSGFVSKTDARDSLQELKQIAAKIDDIVIARAKTPRTPAEVFAPALPPPGVVPANVKMAFDDATVQTLTWAQTGLASVWQEGLTFLGYPYLSELSQRPEYRRASEIISTEMTRKWVKFVATGEDDKTDKITKIEAEFKRLKVREAFQQVAAMDGFMGRAHLYLDTGATDDRTEILTPLGNGSDKASKAKVNQKSPLHRVKMIEPIWTYPSQYNSTDPLRSDWYKPTSWFVMGKEIHASRLLTFIGREVPDLLKPAYSFGGLALSQMLKPYVDNWLNIRQAVADIVQAFSVFVLKTDLNAATLANGGDQFFNRLDLFNLCRSNRGVLAVDKTNEDFDNVAAPINGLDALQAQAQEHQAAVTGIPLVKYFGITPTGLNASSDGELRSFYDWIHAYQEHFFSDNLTRVLGFVQLSLFGEVDPEIGFQYEPLWTLDDVQLATKRKVEADTDAVLIDAGVLSQLEARKRVAADPDTPYAGLDVDDVPEPSPEELEELGRAEQGFGRGEEAEGKVDEPATE